MDGVVYIPHEPPQPRDLSSANRYGRIVTVLGVADRPGIKPGPCYFKLCKDLRNFRPDKDYICFAGGDPLSLGLAFGALVYNGVREFNFLRWERERSTTGERTTGVGFYVPTRILLNG